MDTCVIHHDDGSAINRLHHEFHEELPHVFRGERLAQFCMGQDEAALVADGPEDGDVLECRVLVDHVEWLAHWGP